MQRACAIIFLICLANALWSLVGSWSIVSGGEYYKYYDTASRRSGIFSCRGFLVVALRETYFMGAGLRPQNWETLKPIRQRTPWSVRADLHVGPDMFGSHPHNGILEDRPRTVLPGLLVNWQPSAGREWYNRGIAVHWTLLTVAFGIWPLAAAIRVHRRITSGRCVRCGYDLRATQSRCPECGSTREGGDTRETCNSPISQSSQ